MTIEEKLKSVVLAGYCPVYSDDHEDYRPFNFEMGDFCHDTEGTDHEHFDQCVEKLYDKLVELDEIKI